MRPVSYHEWDLVVSCEEFLAKSPMKEYAGVVVHCPMRDEDDFQINERAIRAAAEAAIEMYRLGGRVLIHCTGGLNRSSVVTAMMLLGLGYTRREAIQLIRNQRDPLCLCNRFFERWVLNEPLPTAETSTFWEVGNEPADSSG